LASPAPLEFNSSHSLGLAVIALTAGCELGVDIEQVRPMSDMKKVAGHFFCPGEVAELSAFPLDQYEQGFFLCWTRKEAYVKATGEGLSLPLDSFQVSIRPGEAARFIRLPDQPNSWTLQDLQLAPNYAAALAYRDAERPLIAFRLSDPAELLSLQGALTLYGKTFNR
jgi:4'-phosphopantetheinyl transferase